MTDQDDRGQVPNHNSLSVRGQDDLATALPFSVLLRLSANTVISRCRGEAAEQSRSPGSTLLRTLIL